jgi:hypothetical protein
MRRALVLVSMLLLGGGALADDATARKVVLLELYTSQG